MTSCQWHSVTQSRDGWTFPFKGTCEGSSLPPSHMTHGREAPLCQTQEGQLFHTTPAWDLPCCYPSSPAWWIRKGHYSRQLDGRMVCWGQLILDFYIGDHVKMFSYIHKIMIKIYKSKNSHRSVRKWCLIWSEFETSCFALTKLSKSLHQLLQYISFGNQHGICEMEPKRRWCCLKRMRNICENGHHWRFTYMGWTWK